MLTLLVTCSDSDAISKRESSPSTSVSPEPAVQVVKKDQEDVKPKLEDEKLKFSDGRVRA